MSVVIRLARAGTKKKPIFHVVAADNNRPRDGKYLARLGVYNPKVADKDQLKVDDEAVQGWIKKGAQVSETVGHLLKAAAKLKQ
ncbi:MAG: 30S ribosomal protein S16 [Bdellovibrionota bacterium]